MEGDARVLEISNSPPPPPTSHVQGTRAVCLPILEVMLSAFLETIELSHMFIKRQGKKSTLPCGVVSPPHSWRRWLRAVWLQRWLFCNLLCKIRVALKFCGRVKATPHPSTGGS